MSCPFPPELLLLYDSGELEGEDARKAADHVPGCAACAARLAGLKRTGQLLAVATAVPASPVRRKRVGDAVFVRRSFRPGWVVALAAAALLALVIGRGLIFQSAPDPWAARHAEALRRMERPTVPIAGVADSTGSLGAGPDTQPPDHTGQLRIAREAVLAWSSLVSADVLFPDWLPTGTRFRDARVSGEGSKLEVELLFEGGGRSFLLFVRPPSVEEPSERTVQGMDGRPLAVLRTRVDGLEAVLVGDGAGLDDLRKVRDSLHRVKKE